jgi:hypothetical protein
MFLPAELSAEKLCALCEGQSPLFDIEVLSTPERLMPPKSYSRERC